MLFDWFTFIAQIVNFLILVYLLWRFLYKPITQTMDKRQKQIESNWQEAQQQREEAKAEADSYRRQRQEWEEQQAEAMARAKEAAEEQRKMLIRQARQEVNQIEAEWRASLRRQQSDFLAQLRQQVGEQTYNLVRRTLRDVVDVEIEQQAIAIFLERLRNLPQPKRDEITYSLERSRSPILIRSSFELSQQQQEKLLDTIQQQFAMPAPQATGGQSLRAVIEKELAVVEGIEEENEETAEVPAHQIPVQFVTSARLICGISLLIAGQEIGWNFQGYLSDVEARFSRRLKAEIEKKWEPEDEQQRQMERTKREQLRQQLVQQTYAVAHRALQDLADADLEERAIAVFLKRLQELDESECQEIARALAESQKAIAIHSSFEIPQDKREQIAHQLQQKQLLDDRELKFSTSPDLICGIEMQLANRSIIWSLENYMQSLEKHLAVAVKEEKE